MIRMIAIFLLVFMGFFHGIIAFRQMSGKEQWELTKLLGYSILCSVLTVVTLGVIVIVF